MSSVLMNETHTPYYSFRDWDITQNDQVFQQAIATVRHLKLRRRSLAGANENILVRATLLFGSQRAMSVCLRYPIPVGHCQ